MTALIPLVGAFGLVLLYEGLTSEAVPRPRSIGHVLERVAAESGIQGATAPRLAGASLATAVVALLLIAGITSSLIVATAFALGAAYAPLAVVAARARSRRNRVRETWPDAIATLVAGVRAGVSLPESCAALAERGPLEMRHAFASFVSTYRAAGVFDAALNRLRQELADPVADRVVAALALAHEVGGTDLVRVLQTLSDFVREDLRVRKEIQARWSWTVTAARVASGAPWVVLVLMSTRPEAAAAYNSATGALVIAGGFAATLLGYRWMLRAARLPEERRLS